MQPEQGWTECPAAGRPVSLSAEISSFSIVDAASDHTGVLKLHSGKHVEYQVQVSRDGGRSYIIRKRFSAFAELRATLINLFGPDPAFNLPPKSLFRHFEAEYIDERMNGLNAFLKEVCSNHAGLACQDVIKFFEPQMLPEWGCVAEPEQRGCFGGLKDIIKGGRRSMATFSSVMQMINEYKKFKEEVAELMKNGADDEQIRTKSLAYLNEMAERLRDMMLRNGGFQVKMGQAISAQKSLLPREITQPLSACCDKANSLPLSEIQGQVRLILGRPLEEVFEYISNEPLAAASIAQVHHAKLRETGEEVVVKVVHPGVAESMRADAAFMPYLIKLVERVEPNHGLHPLAVTMENMLTQELDMRREGQNRERLAAVVAHSDRSGRSGHAEVIFPRVYWDLCRDGLMVQEYARGAVALTSQEAVEALGVPYRLAVAELAEVFGETAFVHGYLHNDLHPGNVLVRLKAGAQPSLSPQLRRRAIFAVMSAVYLAMIAVAMVLVRITLAVLRPALVWLGAGCCTLAVGAVGAVVAHFDRNKDLQGNLAELSQGLLGPALLLGAQVLGAHLKLQGKVDRVVAQAAEERFDLIIIDHGFHTNLPYAFRMTWCKVWAAVGLNNEPLLKEAAAELNLEGDEYRVLPLILCFLPYANWIKQEFPSPASLIEGLKDEDFGLPRCKSLDRKMPPLWHLVMRVNGQVSALFQMQYGVTPTTRYEFMRFMTRSALIGLRFKEHPIADLPVPSCLSTADRAFFERELPQVEEYMKAHFKWSHRWKFDPWQPGDNFLKNLRKEISESDEARAREASPPGRSPSEPQAQS